MVAGHKVVFGFESELGNPSGIKRYSLQLRSAMVSVASDAQSVSRAEVRARYRPFVAEAWSRGLRVPLALTARAGGFAVPKRLSPTDVPEEIPVTLHSVSLFCPPIRTQPLVVTVHDLVPLTHPQHLTPRGAAWHQRMLARVVPGASAIVVPTRMVRDQLLTHFSLPDLAARVFVAGGASSLPKPNAEDWSQRPRGSYVVFVGMIEPRKRLDALIAAMALLETISLVVVGSQGWGEVNIRGLADRAGLAPSRLIFVPGAGDQVLANIIAGADALVLPSEAEGFGLPLVEAMALGTPVVHSSDPALCEVASDAGITVALHPNSAVYARSLAEGITAATTQRDQHSKRGLVRSAMFSWEDSARRVWGIHTAL